MSLTYITGMEALSDGKEFQTQISVYEMEDDSGWPKRKEQPSSFYWRDINREEAFHTIDKHRSTPNFAIHDIRIKVASKVVQDFSIALANALSNSLDQRDVRADLYKLITDNMGKFKDV